MTDAQIITHIRAAYERAVNAEAEWIDATLELAALLGEARGDMTDKEFGHWIVDAGLEDINAHDRRALIKMSKNLALARVILQETKRRSWQLIWLEEMESRFANASNQPQVQASTPETSQTPSSEPETPESTSQQTTDPKQAASARDKTSSSLAGIHERAFLAIKAMTSGRHCNVRQTFNRMSDKVTKRRGKAEFSTLELWVRYLDQLADAIESGKRKPEQNARLLKIEWAFPDGLPTGIQPSLKTYDPESDKERAAFFGDLRKIWSAPAAPSAAAPVAVQVVVSLEGVKHTRGEPRVVLADNQLFPPPYGSNAWTLDDAAVAVDLARTLWAEIVVRQEPQTARNFAFILQRVFIELKNGTSLLGVATCFQRIAAVLHDLPSDAATRNLPYDAPLMPINYA